MMLKYFEELEKGIETALRDKPESWSANKVRALEVARMGKRLYTSDNNVAWCGVYTPFDLLNAMGVTSCFVEFIGAMLSSTGAAIPALDQAEQAGFPSDACGFHRAVLGAALQGWMPKPRCLIGTSSPCTGGLFVIEELSRHFKKDLFIIQIPQDYSKSNVEYLADQLRDMVDFVADQTGTPLDEEKLRTTLEYSNKARKLYAEVHQLASHVPSPAKSRDLANLSYVMILLFGRPEAITIAEAFKKQFETLIKAEKSGVEGEKIRLLWLQSRIQYKNSLIEMLEKDFKASIIVDEFAFFGRQFVDPENPYHDLAERMIAYPFNGTIDHRIEYIQKIATMYKVNGAINPCHFGCRQGSGARGLMQKGLEHVGVPVLNLEVDCIDERNFSEGQFKTRIEAFLEMMG